MVNHTTVYTFDVTTTGDGTVIVTIPEGVATDAAGNGNTASDPYTVTVNTTMVTVTLDSPTPDDNLQTGNTVSYTSIFSEDVTNFDETGITVTGSASGGAPAISNFVAINATAYTFDVVTAGDGTVTVMIPADAATVPAGKTLTASDPYTVTVDTIAPVFSSAVVHDAYTIVITASEPLAGTVNRIHFGVSVNTISNTISDNTLVGNLEISGSTITINVDNAIPIDGTVTVSYHGNTITDLAGNALATFGPQSVTNDDVPTVTLTNDDTINGSTADSRTLSYTVQFSEPVTGFGDQETDIALSGTARTATVSIPIEDNEVIYASTEDGIRYTFTVVASTDGTVTVQIPAAVAIDAGGNLNAASGTHTVTVDAAAPVFVSAATVTSTMIAITTSEPIVGTVTASDFVMTGNAFTAVPVIFGNIITITVDTAITTSADDITVSYPVSSSDITDAAGNPLVEFTPQAVINNVPGAADPTDHIISPVHSVELPDNGYRHDLIHLTGNYYVSSHTVSVYTGIATWNHNTDIRLYSITDGQISLIGSQTVATVTDRPIIFTTQEVDPPTDPPTDPQIVAITPEDSGENTDDAREDPRSTSIVRIDDDTIAISHVRTDTDSTEGTVTTICHPVRGCPFISTVTLMPEVAAITTFDVDTTSMTPFVNRNSVDYRTGDTGGQISSQSLIAFDADTLIITYSHSNSSPDGFIQAIRVAPDGALSAGVPVSITADQGRYQSAVKLDADTVVLAYRGADAAGHIQAFDVSSGDTSVLTPRTAIPHDAGRTAYNSLLQIDDSTVALGIL